MGCGTFGGCNGGSGTSGQGRTPYTPKRSGGTIWNDGSGRKSSGSGSSRTVGKQSDFGTPKVKLSFSSRNRK